MENNSDPVTPLSKSSSFLSKRRSSKRDRSNPMGKGSRSHSSSPPPAPITQSLQMKYTPQSSSPKSDDSSQFPFKDLPSGALGKARDRNTFKGVFDKFVGSFNGKKKYT